MCLSGELQPSNKNPRNADGDSEDRHNPDHRPENFAERSSEADFLVLTLRHEQIVFFHRKFLSEKMPSLRYFLWQPVRVLPSGSLALSQVNSEQDCAGATAAVFAVDHVAKNEVGRSNKSNPRRSARQDRRTWNGAIARETHWTKMNESGAQMM